jgi:SAM-dependent methyltransferase
MKALWTAGAEASTPRRILVAGCGSGSEAFAMRRTFPEAEIVGVDFSPRSIAVARELQKRKRTTSGIRFVHGDIADRRLLAKVGRDFDFISCHGVLSYVPHPTRALENLARALDRNGALHLGVNGATHVSVGLRLMLRQFGIDPSALGDETREAKTVLRVADAMRGGATRLARYSDELLASDVFGRIIHNLPLAAWLRMARKAGLHLRGSYGTWRKLRAPMERSAAQRLIPRSRAEVCELMEMLSPSPFHALLFTRRAAPGVPWEDPAELLPWRPCRTRLYTTPLRPRRGSLRAMRRQSLESAAARTRLDWRLPEWQLEVLRRSNGMESLGDIVEAMPIAISRRQLHLQLYLLYQLLVIDLVPPRRRA